MTTDEYLLDNRAAESGKRFGALSALYDPVTFRHMDALGVQNGWRCWEVGAGGPSVPLWLADRAGDPEPSRRHRGRSRARLAAARLRLGTQAIAQPVAPARPVLPTISLGWQLAAAAILAYFRISTAALS
jgi:hypothetical protein